MAEQNIQPQQQGGNNPAVTFLLVLLVLSVLAGVSFFGYKIFMGEIKIPGINTPPIAPGSSTVSNSSSSASPEIESAGGSKSPGTGTQGATEQTQQQATVSGKKWFPLKRVTGAALHTVNPFVKDLQQYLNKYKGTNLDIDGAFGGDTEKEVIKAFGGEKEISMNDYNIAIAPYIGKPQVV